MKVVFLAHHQEGEGRVAESGGAFQNGVEYRPVVCRRAADGAQDVAGRGLALERLAEWGFPINPANLEVIGIEAVIEAIDKGLEPYKRLFKREITRDEMAAAVESFADAARRYGTVGGFAHLKTLIERLRGEAGAQNCLLLDGGDTWQGSGTAYWTRGRDMVGACNRLGVDVMTGHWEFTYQDSEVLGNIDEFAGEFVAQNVYLTDDALFSGADAFDEDNDNDGYGNQHTSSKAS